MATWKTKTEAVGSGTGMDVIVAMDVADWSRWRGIVGATYEVRYRWP